MISTPAAGLSTLRADHPATCVDGVVAEPVVRERTLS
jgi:hypothetical protein